MEPHDHVPPLRPYQRTAVDMAVSRGSLLLALTMGAGKTRVAIEAVKELDPGPGVVFCTNSLKYQWAEVEIPKWHPGATALVVDGTKKKRTAQYEQAADHDYTVLSYDMLVHDWDLIREHLPLGFVIADEATLIKGFRAKRSKRLKAMAQHVPYRFALSGQPVENRPEELFSIMEFVDPEVLGPFHKFDRAFIVRDPSGRPRRYRNLNVLNDLMSGAMYRKSREDIAAFLPDKVELEVPVRLDPKTQKVYDHVRDDLLRLLDDMASSGSMSNFDLMAHYGRSDDQSGEAKGQIMARITAMRLLCSHPYLLARSAADFDDAETSTGSAYASELVKAKVVEISAYAGDCLDVTAGSNKAKALFHTLSDVFEEDETAKVVVFSGFKPMISLIGQQLAAAKIGFTSMTGDTPAQERQRRMDRFNHDPRCRVFVSSDAGAYGINLNAGSHLINYDFPWSAGALAQRVARIDRTSSERSQISIVHLYNHGTIEHRQLEMLRQKSEVAEAFVDGRGADARGSLSLTLSSLREFLSHGPLPVR